MLSRRSVFAELMISDLYYSRFAGNTFVIQAGAKAVDQSEIALAVLEGIGELLRHDIRVAMVLGMGAEFNKGLRATFGAREHRETSRLVIPEKALSGIRQERLRVTSAIEELCHRAHVPCRVLPESVIRAERRLAHGSTGVVSEIDAGQIRSVLDRQQLAVFGFGGQDDHGRFLQVPSTTLAADLAVELGAQKLLFLMEADGIFLPDGRGHEQQLSLADLEELLCLLQRKDGSGNLILFGDVVPKIHASIRAVAGGVGQIHLVSYLRLLDEILTRTGVGTMVEYRQSHHVDDARTEDLEEIQRLHAESQRYTSGCGTPYVKPLEPSEVKRMLPRTLVLRHRGVIVGKLHATEVAGIPRTLQIGGFVIGENHQDSQQGRILLLESLGRFRERGHVGAVAVTASERAKQLFARCGGQPSAGSDWQAQLLEAALERYSPEERSQVRLFEFSLADCPLDDPASRGP